jgi:hypothetical protein
LRADANAKQITAYKIETEECKLATQKYKQTADNLQKKSFRIETLLDEARREVEDLRTAKSNLLLDLETQQTQSATEIEMLEASNDQLRLELEVPPFLSRHSLLPLSTPSLCSPLSPFVSLLSLSLTISPFTSPAGSRLVTMLLLRFAML